MRLTLDGSWLGVLVSERTPLAGRISSVLKLAQEVMTPDRFALLPVRFGPGEWTLSHRLLNWPRIDEADDELSVTTPSS